MTWKFLNTGRHPGKYNMEFDEALARGAADLPVMRVYGWSPPAISLGFNQALGDFDIPALGRSGIDIVRRPTGGKAIFHDHELTYSVAISAGAGPRAIYRLIHEGLLRGLMRLGISAELSECDAPFRELRREPASIPCFSFSARSEIQYRGRKLVGSAQRRYGPVVLQHGSILLGPQHRRIGEFLSPALRSSRESIERRLESRTADAEEILGRGISYDEAAESILGGFEEFLTMKEACGIL